MSEIINSTNTHIHLLREIKISMCVNLLDGNKITCNVGLGHVIAGRKINVPFASIIN